MDTQRAGSGHTVEGNGIMGRQPVEESTSSGPESSGAALSGRARRVRRWVGIAVASNVLFTGAWLPAASWQGPRYSFSDAGETTAQLRFVTEV